MAAKTKGKSPTPQTQTESDPPPAGGPNEGGGSSAPPPTLPPPSTDPDFQTPGDDSAPKPKANHPTKGRRYRVMGEGEGDYCIYEIAQSASNLPKGSLIPIPKVPRFETTAEALRWIRNDSGDSLAGKAVMVFLAMEMLRIEVTNKPQLEITRKPKVLVHDPEKVDGAT